MVVCVVHVAALDFNEFSMEIDTDGRTDGLRLRTDWRASPSSSSILARPRLTAAGIPKMANLLPQTEIVDSSSLYNAVRYIHTPLKTVRVFDSLETYIGETSSLCHYLESKETSMTSSESTNDAILAKVRLRARDAAKEGRL